MADLNGAHALVTGAGSGVGRAIALALTARGAFVGICGRNAQKLAATREAAANAKMVLWPADLSEDQEMDELVKRVRTEWDRLDILVHSAGIITAAPVADAQIDDFDCQYRINTRAPYRLSKLLLPLLLPDGGDIIFINSSAGLAARAGLGQYAASKHALKAIADSLREEVNSHGVRVLSVYLGRTATPMQEQVHKLEERRYQAQRLIQPGSVGELVAGILALPPTAEVTDVHLRPALKPL